jgi:hypothetical protein
MNDAYKQMMYINTVFSKEKNLELMIEDVNPHIKVRPN